MSIHTIHTSRGWYTQSARTLPNGVYPAHQNVYTNSAYGYTQMFQRVYTASATQWAHSVLCIHSTANVYTYVYTHMLPFFDR